MMSRSAVTPRRAAAAGRSLMMSRQAVGFTRLAAPTYTAVAPASIISSTSSALDTPPIPMRGMSTASYT